jgi:hypothetical protein
MTQPQTPAPAVDMAQLVAQHLAMLEAADRAKYRHAYLHYPGDPPEDPGGRPVVVKDKQGRVWPARWLRSFMRDLLEGDSEGRNRVRGQVEFSELVVNFGAAGGVPEWRPLIAVQEGKHFRIGQPVWAELPATEKKG